MKTNSFKTKLVNPDDCGKEVSTTENDICIDSEQPKTNFLTTKRRNTTKFGKRSLLKLFSVDSKPVVGLVNDRDKECEQNNKNENCEESEPASSNFRTPTFVTKTTNVSSPKPVVNSSKRKRDRIDDFQFPTQIIPFSDQGGKDYSKVNCCCFCYSLEIRVDRHLYRHHPEESEVQFIIHSKSLIETKAKYKELRLRGNDIFNSDRTLNPKGIILCSRRISRKKMTEKQQLLETTSNSTEEEMLSANDISDRKQSTIKSSISSTTDLNQLSVSGVFKLRCKHCCIWVAPTNLRNHTRLAHPELADRNSKQILNDAKRCMLSMHPKTDPRVKDHIFAKIRDPIISALVRNDILIILLANKLADKYVNIKQLDMVRGYVRLIAKFMLQMKELNPEIKDFKMIFRTQYFEDVIKAIRIVSEYDERTQRFGITYNAETLPIILRKCYKILRHHLVAIKDAENNQNLSDFIAFFEDDIQNTISVKACLSRKDLNRHTNDKALPVSNDIVIFREFLNDLRTELLEEIKSTKKMTYNQYYILTACVALLIETFNRRRNGEVSTVNCKDFDSIKRADQNCEFFQQLTAEQKQERLAFYRMDIQGKRFDGKGSLHLDNLDYDCINLLLRHRNSYNIPETNPYLFAVKSGADNVEKSIDLYDAMCRFAKKCNEEYKPINHVSIRSTALRKHAATVNGVIDNGKNTAMCAELLGHSQQMQKNKY